MITNPDTRYAFAEKYSAEHAMDYFNKHNVGIARKLSNYLELQAAKKALAIADYPQTVLDLPSGTGRFWQTLLTSAESVIAADNSINMINAGLSLRAPSITDKITTLHCSAFSITLPDNAVDSSFCIRLLHHIRDSADRISILKELARVSKETVVISLWVDGNYKAYRRHLRDVKGLKPHKDKNRYVIPRTTIEADIQAAGLSVRDTVDHIKYYSMWRFYVLEKTQS